MVQRTLSFPWRDFTTFKAHWLRNGCYNSWQARRDLLNELFAPVQTELDRQEEAQFRAVNAEAASPHTKTGWPKWMRSSPSCVDISAPPPPRRATATSATAAWLSSML